MMPFSRNGSRHRALTVASMSTAALLVLSGLLAIVTLAVPAQDPAEPAVDPCGEMSGQPGTSDPGAVAPSPPERTAPPAGIPDEEGKTRASGRSDPVETLSYDLRYKDPSPVAYGGFDMDWTGWKMEAGDLNGDGYDDWIISSPWNDGKGSGADDAGRVHIIFGDSRPNLQASDRRFEFLTEDVTLYGLDPGDSFGYALAVGDFNGDGTDDLAVGAPWADGPQDTFPACGEVYIFYGRDVWPDEVELDDDALLSDANLTINGAKDNGWLGYSLDTGNIDNDGRDELLMGAPRADGTGVKLWAGMAYLAAGSELVTAANPWNLSVTPPLLSVEGRDSNDYYGSGVMMADWDDAGREEIFVGAVQGDGPSNNRTNGGEIAVVQLPDAFIPPVYHDLSADGPAAWIYGPDGGDGVGRRMTSGDVNGDLVTDLVVGVPEASGPNNKGNETGEVHLIFGDMNIFGGYGSGTEEYDLGIHADVTWYGITDYDRAGYSQECVDLDGDGKAEILVGAQDANGPLNKRHDSGEVYVVSGQYAEVGDGWSISGGSLANNTVIYGVDAEDELGTSVASGDLDNDGYPDILMGARGGAGYNDDLTGAGECYVLFAFPEAVELGDFTLADGASPESGDPQEAGKVCLAGLRGYTFTLDAVAPPGSADVRSVNVSLDPDMGRQNLQMSWDRDAGFSEVWDPDDMMELDTAGSSVDELSGGNFKAHFKVSFAWDFPTERLLGARVKVDCVNAMSRNCTFRNVFMVENDLNMTGELSVTSGGEPLSDGDWVPGGSSLQWSGLKVHYQDNAGISPPDDAFDIEIADDDGDTWLQTAPSALGLDLTTTADAASDPEDNHTISVVNVGVAGLPGGPEIPAPLHFTLRVDADPPEGARNITFVADPGSDSEAGDLYDDDKVFTFHWDPSPDNGSGTDGHWYSMGYNDGAYNGMETNATTGGFSNAPEGPNTVYIWSYDAVGNIEGPQDATILLDFKALEAAAPVAVTPTAPGGTYNVTSINVTAGFSDPESFGAESGVDPSTVSYAILGPEETIPLGWMAVGIGIAGLDDAAEKAGARAGDEVMDILSSRSLTVGEKEALTGLNTTSMSFFTTVELPEGTSRVIWRAADIAGGMRVTSPELEVTVNTSLPAPNAPPVAVITSPTAGGEYLSWKPVAFSSQGTYDPDGDILTYFWTSSVDGTVLEAAEGEANLTAGNHTITLTVEDGRGGGAFVALMITVMLDSDVDSVPDEFDDDDDNDGVPDTIDDAPLDPNIGDLDGGDGGGGDEGDDKGGAATLVAVAVVIVILVVVVAAALVMRSRRQRMKADEAKGADGGVAMDAEVELTPGWGISSKSEVDMLTGGGVDTTGVTADTGAGAAGQTLPASGIASPAGAGAPPEATGAGAGGPGAGGGDPTPAGATSLAGAGGGAEALPGAGGPKTPLLPKPRGIDPENPFTPGEPAYQDAPAESPYGEN